MTVLLPIDHREDRGGRAVAHPGPIYHRPSYRPGGYTVWGCPAMPDDWTYVTEDVASKVARRCKRCWR